MKRLKDKMYPQDEHACEDGQAYSVRTVYTVILFYF